MQRIPQRELRNDNAALIRRVLEGEGFIITRNGVDVADLIPHRDSRVNPRRRLTAVEIQRKFQELDPIDTQELKQELADADKIFGFDAITDPWGDKD